MLKDLRIRDTRDGLVITATQANSLANAIVSSFVVGAVVAIALRRLLETPFLAVMTIVAMGLSLWLGIRKRGIELRVSNLELISRGRCGDNFRSVRNVNRAEIRWLEYEEDTTGPESSHHPGGLYAVLRHQSICIFPYANEEQAAAIIQRIVERFPDLVQQLRAQSSFGEHFTSLGLDRPSSK
jgi:hypothetical protein